jgi:hypothetical protein
MSELRAEIMEVQEDVRRESESDVSSAQSPTEVNSQATSASRYQVTINYHPTHVGAHDCRTNEHSDTFESWERLALGLYKWSRVRIPDLQPIHLQSWALWVPGEESKESYTNKMNRSPILYVFTDAVALSGKSGCKWTVNIFSFSNECRKIKAVTRIHAIRCEGVGHLN